MTARTHQQPLPPQNADVQNSLPEAIKFLLGLITAEEFLEQINNEKENRVNFRQLAAIFREGRKLEEPK